MSSGDNHTRTTLFYLRAVSAGYLMDRCKNLKSLTLELNYLSPGPSLLSSRKETRGPYDSAFFEFVCPRGDCMEGGFDISSPVTEMLSSLAPECAGTVSCRGWRFNKENAGERCGCKLEYRVLAEYFERERDKKAPGWLKKLFGKKK